MRKKNIYVFFNTFINVYLPILDRDQNIIKLSTIISYKPIQIYRFNYFNFPVIPESDFLCYNNENLVSVITTYQIRFDFYLKSFIFLKNSLEFLFRMFRLPIIIKTALLK